MKFGQELLGSIFAEWKVCRRCRGEFQLRPGNLTCSPLKRVSNATILPQILASFSLFFINGTNDAVGGIQYYYMDYPGLKRLLKSMTTVPSENPESGAPPIVKPITDDDEARFQTEMRKELEKVVAFHRLKTEELRRRIDDAEKVVESILASPQGNDDERRKKVDEVLKEVRWPVRLPGISVAQKDSSHFAALTSDGQDLERSQPDESIQQAQLFRLPKDAQKARQIFRTTFQANL